MFFAVKEVSFRKEAFRFRSDLHLPDNGHNFGIGVGVSLQGADFGNSTHYDSFIQSPSSPQTLHSVAFLSSEHVFFLHVLHQHAASPLPNRLLQRLLASPTVCTSHSTPEPKYPQKSVECATTPNHHIYVKASNQSHFRLYLPHMYSSTILVTSNTFPRECAVVRIS